MRLKNFFLSLARNDLVRKWSTCAEYLNFWFLVSEHKIVGPESAFNFSPLMSSTQRQNVNRYHTTPNETILQCKCCHFSISCCKIQLDYLIKMASGVMSTLPCHSPPAPLPQSSPSYLSFSHSQSSFPLHLPLIPLPPSPWPLAPCQQMQKCRVTTKCILLEEECYPCLL